MTIQQAEDYFSQCPMFGAKTGMTIQQAEDYFSQCPMFGAKTGLDDLSAVLQELGNPHRKLRFVHIAGTNGKGSTAAMLSSVFTCAGYRTGLYTSPHLIRFSERIQINGTPIPDEDLIRFTETLCAAVERSGVSLSYFKAVTALAFLYFADRQCDIVILETGLGGRWDATNVIQSPEAVIITSIGLDHTAVLGNTIAQIAAEKAGICKPGCPVVLSPVPAEAEDVIRAAAQACSAPLYPVQEARILFHDESGQTLLWNKQAHHLPLLGVHQCRNAAAALTAIALLRQAGWQLSEQAVRQGLDGVQWPGRFEVLQKDPLVILDGAHNPQGVAMLLDSLRRYFPERSYHFIIGMMADKDWQPCAMAAGQKAASCYAVTPPGQRALHAKKLADTLQTVCQRVYVKESLCAALAEAKARAGAGDVICIFGSLYQIAQAKACYPMV